MVEFDRDWDELPIAELHELDALCDRFEHAIAADPQTRIEPFVVDLDQSQQRLAVRELMRLEIESRFFHGQPVEPDEFAERFPQWDELRRQAIEDIENARAVSETINQTSSSDVDTKTDHQTWSELPLAATQQDAVPRNQREQEDWKALAAEPCLADLPTGGMLGHYQLQTIIGRGGMGLVVRARDTKLDRDVAIKILAPQISHNATINERFLREAQAAAAIRHNHVVTIHAVETINGVSFLVMELVDGPTLEENLRANGKLSADEVAMLAYQIAQGLAAAHRQGLIHRDVKPANILLEKVDQHGSGLRAPSTWHAKITDFGLARIAAEVRLTSSGLIAGTPQYMSPEQANGEELDVRSDLFSLGSVMYAMCAGRAAFDAESAIAIVRQVADKPALSLREVSPETPAWLIETIERLMSKSPDDRIQSASELATLLGHYIHGEHTSAPSPPSFAGERVEVRVPSLTRRTATLIPLTLVSIAIVAFAIAMSGRDNNIHEANDSPASRAAVAYSPRPAIAPFTQAEAVADQEAWAKHLAIDVESSNSIGMKFRLLPPGEFMMGSSNEEIGKLLQRAEQQELDDWYVDRIPFEGPQHQVTLTKPFAMGMHEVTRGQFREFVETTKYQSEAERDRKVGSAWQDGKWADAPKFLWNTHLGFDSEQTDEHPVVNVSWNDAMAFCKWLSEVESVTYRLPTEAEWEFACRAGSVTRFSFGDSERQLLDYSWIASQGSMTTQLVGQKKPNAFGLFDLHGNVFEWCQDPWYGVYSSAPAVDPIESVAAGVSTIGNDSDRVLRGGSFANAASEVRSALRRSAVASHRSAVTGFRLVRTFD